MRGVDGIFIGLMQQFCFFNFLIQRSISWLFEVHKKFRSKHPGRRGHSGRKHLGHCCMLEYGFQVKVSQCDIIGLYKYCIYCMFHLPNPALILDSTEADLAPLSFNKLSLKFIFISSIHQNKIEAF